MATAVGANTASAADPAGSTAKAGVAAPREINITTDSAPGWLPSADLEKSAADTASAFLNATDQGRYAQAYDLRADLLNRQESQSAFTSRVQTFNAEAGAVVERRLIKFTWTKDPAQAPAPGIYVAIDLVSTFRNVDRHCGYLVLYEPAVGGSFKIVREEQDFMSNKIARDIAQKQGSAEVEKVWAKVSAHCPNYPRGLPATPTASTAPLPEAPSTDIGYPTVDDALKALRARPDVTTTVQNGWIVAADNAAKTVWSFPPPGHPAYPAAVKRQLVDDRGGTSMVMSVHCEASKQACDDLVRTFEQLNEQMKNPLKAR